jgi:hypothetical protein
LLAGRGWGDLLPTKGQTLWYSMYNIIPLCVEEFIRRLAGTCATVPLIIKVPYFAVLIVITSVYGTLIYTYTQISMINTLCF